MPGGTHLQRIFWRAAEICVSIGVMGIMGVTGVTGTCNALRALRGHDTNCMINTPPCGHPPDRRPETLIHHSGRGVQYACGEFADRLKTWQIVLSMSRVGNPCDTAKAKSFMTQRAAKPIA